MGQQKTYAVILNYNSANESIALYKNLKEQRLPYLRILVIDNNSISEDQLQLKGYIPTEHLIFNQKNLGYAGGNNIGIEVALNEQADYVWVLNPDIRINNETLPKLLKTLSENKTLAAVGPRILHRKSPKSIFSDGEIAIFNKTGHTYHKNHNFKAEQIPGKIDYEIDYIAGSSILLNCEAIKKIGKFPEEYFLYFEETDWCFKARQNGWNLAIDSNSRVYNLTSEKTSIFHYYSVRNKLIFNKKYNPEFKKLRNYFAHQLLKELFARFKGHYLKPYYVSRIKGLIAGIVKTSFK